MFRTLASKLIITHTYSPLTHPTSLERIVWWPFISGSYLCNTTVLWFIQSSWTSSSETLIVKIFACLRKFYTFEMSNTIRLHVLLVLEVIAPKVITLVVLLSVARAIKAFGILTRWVIVLRSRQLLRILAHCELTNLLDRLLHITRGPPGCGIVSLKMLI